MMEEGEDVAWGQDQSAVPQNNESVTGNSLHCTANYHYIYCK